jgi:hyperosmotically inducible protein
LELLDTAARTRRAQFAPTKHFSESAMNKSNLAVTCAIVGALLAPVLSYAQDADVDRSHPKAFVKDSAITTKIKSRLAAQHLTSVARIHVDTDADGVVWLSGTAKSQEEIDRAVSIARGTERVVAVKNELTVQND